MAIEPAFTPAALGEQRAGSIVAGTNEEVSWGRIFRKRRGEFAWLGVSTPRNHAACPN